VADCRRRASPNKSTLCRTSNTPASAFRPVQAGAIRRPRRDVRFRVAKQQPLDRSIPRRCPPLPHGHVRLARGSAPNRWSISSRFGELSAGSSGVLRSLRPHRRLSAVLLRGSQSALGNLGSIPGRNL